MPHPALLVELLTEELPPKSLSLLGQAFADEIFNGLVHHQLKLRDYSGWRVFATPRRLGVLIPDVHATAGDRESTITGPSVKAGLDSTGKPTPALTGFARKNGIDVAALEQQDSPKGRVFVARINVAGSALDTVLAGIVKDAIKKLPIPKMMRWGARDDQFVRPVHKLVMLHGTRVVPGGALGLAAGNRTQGHRFMSSGDITLANAEEYEAKLRDQGRVVPVFDERKAAIDAMLLSEAKALGAELGAYADLLDEVTALVEHPSVYVGTFDKTFLEVPQECLILTMRQNQKYFPLFETGGRLLPQFLIVSNMQVSDPRHIVGGNQRVVRPRLEDARFFYNQDRRQRLEERVPQLARMVYHNKLGSQLDRVERVQLLAGAVARSLGADAEHAERAAWLAKADLLTGMVGEFPELQGVMGRYYALHDGESPVVADAIEAHYHPRFAGDTLPQGPVAAAVALADKLDTLVGIYGIGLAPTGDKDPFALRRHALGLIRILVELRLPLDLKELVELARKELSRNREIPDWVTTEVFNFIVDRLRGYLRDQGGYQAEEIEAVLSVLQKQVETRIDQLPARLAAVRTFGKLPEARELAAANKRVLNIIRKNAELGYEISAPDRALMKEPAEIALIDAVERLSPQAEAHLREGDFEGNLRLLAKIKPEVDRFFDEVMVMVDDEAVRKNRAALLQQLGALMNRVADISKLAA
jgi:glycyl-tRNA synthetase beta chain